MSLVETDGDISIIAATFEALEAEDKSGTALAAFLGVSPPASWPPEHNGPEVREWTRRVMRRHPDEPGFVSWYLIAGGELVGSLGYKGPPDDNGSVEIGYAVVPERQRRGYASAGIRLLLRRAFSDPRVTAVRAETLPGGLASQGALRKAGFVPAGSRVDPEDGEVLCFERKR